MAESLEHLSLVKLILDYISHEFTGVRHLAALDDLPGFIGGEKPPRIAGYVPDVYAVDIPTTITIIGEAKTSNDLTTDHSRSQITAFLRYLGYQKQGVFILATTWHAIRTARTVVSKCASHVKTTHTRIVFLDGVRN